MFRTVLVFPFAISGTVTDGVWRWPMYPSAGLNRLFDMFGVGPLKSKWYSDPAWGILAITIAATWQFSGYVSDALALHMFQLTFQSNKISLGALIAALPTISVYLAQGKFFMRGLLAGSRKG